MSISHDRMKTGRWETPVGRTVVAPSFLALPSSGQAARESVAPSPRKINLVAPVEARAANVPPPALEATKSPSETNLPQNEEKVADIPVLEVNNGAKNTPVVPDATIANDFAIAALSAAQADAQALHVQPPAIIDQSTGNFNTSHRFADEAVKTLRTTPVFATGEKPAATNLLAFHGLKQQPFDVTPDPAFLYLTQSHHEALTSLSQGIENVRGFMALIAEPGMGKTTLLNKLMEELGDSARVVFLFQTQCTSNELLALILTELEVDHSSMDVVTMHRALNHALMGEMLLGRRFVLIVDEAQNLQDSVLETIRLLSDFETTHSKLIQIVLAGQPQLAETLLRPSLVQLRQRIAVVSNLKPLGAAETSEYVEHRLRAAGWSGKEIFTPDALAAIAETSGGVPRNINNICFNALLMAFTQGQEIIDSEIVGKVAAKLDLEPLVRNHHRDAANRRPGAMVDGNDTVQLARALATALSGARVNCSVQANGNSKPNGGVFVTGNLTDKVLSQSWGQRQEYMIQVSMERDPLAGVPLADRYYCCNLYVGEEQGASLEAGKPVRIRIEQE